MAMHHQYRHLTRDERGKASGQQVYRCRYRMLLADRLKSHRRRDLLLDSVAGLRWLLRPVLEDS